ncbi:hypothetical protein Lbir_2839 [Legionella birminghamensis]|uniref:Uncharacterized protein n=1 Tax=Legionella birminghamensis TaxID=28083 RepID=A0A378I884_9GAMM|nr:hypothetical protein [Legionella birminghamensis]KTC68237.1 hypothetical protein Lbir_2839 [Legionella birminghamensis]STX31052.1 Uncharacterised protein [Legionella birminghamensis]
MKKHRKHISKHLRHKKHHLDDNQLEKMSGGVVNDKELRRALSSNFEKVNAFNKPSPSPAETLTLKEISSRRGRSEPIRRPKDLGKP